MKIDNQPDSGESFIKDHHWRHLFTGTLVFALGIVANELVVNYKQKQPRKVIWFGDNKVSYHIVSNTPPSPDVKILLGISEDGIIVWKMASPDAAKK